MKFFNLFVSVFALILSSCSEEQPLVFSDKDQKIVDVLQTSTDESIKNLKVQYQNLLNRKTTNSLDLTLDFDNVYTDSIFNSNARMTVIPGRTKYKKTRTKALLFKAKDIDYAVLFHNVHISGNDWSDYYGFIVITDIFGKLIRQFRVERGIVVSEFIINDASKTFRGDPDDCTSPGCSLGEGEEVVVYGNAPYSGFPVAQVLPTDAFVNLDGQDWAYNDGGGSGGQANRNNLCGDYPFKKIGNAYVLNLENIGMTLSNGQTSIPAVFNNLCITVPAYNVGQDWYSNQLKLAWSMTTDQVFTYVNNTRGLIPISELTLKATVLEMFTANLNFVFALNGGSSVVPSWCNGAPTKRAQYCG